MKKFYAVFFVLLLENCVFCYASICGFQFEGLKRTKKDYLFRVLHKFVGEDCNEKTLDSIETALREQGLFSEIKIEVQSGETGEVVRITLKEKISFLPVPFGSYTNDGLIGGFVAMDNNAFGRRDSFMVGGVFSKNLKTALAAFSKLSTDTRHPGFSLFANFAQKKYELATLDGEVFQKISAKKFSFSASFIEKISSQTQLSLGAKYSGCLFDDFADSHQTLFVPQVKWKKSDWNGFFLSETAAQASAEIGFYATGEFVTGERLRAFFQRPILPRLRFSAEALLCADQNKQTTDQMTRGDAGTSILPQNFYFSRIFSANFTLEGAVLTTKHGILSLYAAHQLDACDDYDGESDFSYGFGAGILAYLAKINMPALSFGVYYNIPHNAIQFGLSAGASF